MTMGRDRATATLLLDGRVLIAGGSTYAEAGSAELYDPKTGRFSKTGSIPVGHWAKTATLLLDGRVLVIGFGGSDSVDLYDPKTGTFTRTGPLPARWYPDTATRLVDGRVLITGGDDSVIFGDPTNKGHTVTAELYDPKMGTFSQTGTMTTGRFGASATMLRDGRVLIAGSSGSGTSAELYNPTTGTFSSTGSMEIYDAHTATLLNDGRVLVVGGRLADDGYTYSAADVYDPTTGKFTPTSPPKGFCLCGDEGVNAPLLKDGRVLVPVQNWDASGKDVFSAELYDPIRGTFTQAGQMKTNRSGFTDTLLLDGRVLFAGNESPYICAMGCPSFSPSEAAAIVATRSSAELYVP